MPERNHETSSFPALICSRFSIAIDSSVTERIGPSVVSWLAPLGQLTTGFPKGEHQPRTKERADCPHSSSIMKYTGKARESAARSLNPSCSRALFPVQGGLGHHSIKTSETLIGLN